LKNRRTRKEGGLLHGFLPCLGLSALLIPVSALVATAFASASDDPTGKAGLYSLLALLLSAAVSGFTVSRLSGEGGVKLAALCALAIVLIMLLISIIATGKIPSVGALMNYGCYLGVAALSALVGRKREKRHRRRK